MVLVVPDDAEDVDHHQGDEDEDERQHHPRPHLVVSLLLLVQPVHHHDVHHVVEDVEEDVGDVHEDGELGVRVVLGVVTQGVREDAQHGGDVVVPRPLLHLVNISHVAAVTLLREGFKKNV